MVSPDEKVFIKDIFDATERIESFVGNMDFKQFSGDEKTVRSVLYDLTRKSPGRRYLECVISWSTTIWG